MESAPIPENEEQRLDLLNKLDILDTLEEQAYDDLTFLAAKICDVPIALVTLVDRDRQWFKSHFGLDVQETPREIAFCAHAILGDDLLLVEDALQDPRFHDNPAVTGELNVRFYAGEPLVLDDGLRMGTLCVVDDHSRTLSEEQRTSLKALARQVISQLKLRLHIKELQKLDAAKDEFISMVNHELRTPLTSIKGSLSILNHSLSKQPFSNDLVHMADIALRNTDRLLNIVNDILDVAKLEAGKLALNIKPVKLATLITRSVELNAPFCTGCGCRLNLSLPEDIASLEIKGDEHRLLQVLGNFISNAAKFTHKGDTIEVTAALEGHRIRLGVTDHGPGISEEHQKEIFKRFSQLGNTGNSKLPGTGLGLNICKHIIELHGGTIGFDVQKGSTTFFFDLPKK